MYVPSCFFNTYEDISYINIENWPSAVDTISSQRSAVEATYGHSIFIVCVS